MAPKTWFHDKFTSSLPDTAARLVGPALLTVKVWVGDWGVENALKMGRMSPSCFQLRTLNIKIALQTGSPLLLELMAKAHTSHEFWNLSDSLRRAKSRAKRFLADKRALETRVRDLERSRDSWKMKFTRLAQAEATPAPSPPPP